MDANLKPCTNCRRRKVRCNKKDPCSNCVRLKKQCTWDEGFGKHRPTLTLDQPSVVDLFDRLNRIENVVAKINVNVTKEDRLRVGLLQQLDEPGTSNDTSASAFTGRPSAPLENETSRFPFVRYDGTPMSSFPTIEQSNLLVQLFLNTTEPFIRILHVYTFKRALLSYRSGLSAPGFEALLACVHAVTMVTLPPPFVVDMFGSTPEYFTKTLHSSIESNLSAADVLTSRDITMLQALLYYITFLLETLQNEKAGAMVGAALALAVRLSLQRDPSHMSPEIPALEAEVRRRIWHYLLHLDFRASEVLKMDFCISLNPSWHTKVPFNIDDEAWDGFMDNTDGLMPSIVQGYTSMSYAVSRSKIDDLRRKLGRTAEPPTSFPSPAGPQAIQDMIAELRRDIELNCLSNIDYVQPIQNFVAAIIRNRVLKLELIARRQETTPVVSEVADAFSRSLIEIDADDDFARWRWLLPHDRR